MPRRRIFRRSRSRGSATTSRRSGQRAYNGVALLSKEPARDVRRAACRATAATSRRATSRRRSAICASPRSICRTAIPSSTEKFTYKLGWMERLAAHARGAARRASGRSCSPATTTSARPTTTSTTRSAGATTRCAGRNRAARFRALLNMGLVDAFRVFHPEPHRYSFWDYQAGRWYRDEGLRIDHLLLIAAGRRPAARRATSTRARAARTRRPTTRRCGARSARPSSEFQAVAQPQIVELVCGVERRSGEVAVERQVRLCRAPI